MEKLNFLKLNNLKLLCHFVMNIPSQTAPNPTNTLAIMYITAIPVWLLFISIIFSLANVENVVNPPQKPVISRNRRFSEGIRLANMPMQKHPIIFTIKVATGNGHGSVRTIHTEVKNRRILPAAPPAPTNNICFNILQI